MTDRKEELAEVGLLPEPSAFLQARKTLDPFQHFPLEPCHVILSGILGILQDLISSHILSDAPGETYLKKDTWYHTSVFDRANVEWKRTHIRPGHA